MKYTFFVFPTLLLLSCGADQAPKFYDEDEIILSATKLNYSQLDSTFQSKIGSCYCYPKNWNKPHRYPINNCYYVKLKINNDQLANVTESDVFSKKYLLESHPSSLYGKYKNRWELLNENGDKICETSKFEGFHKLEFERVGKYDYITLGPVSEEPFKVRINLSQSRYDRIPEMEIVYY